MMCPGIDTLKPERLNDRLRARALRRRFRRMIRPASRTDLERLGSDYGGHLVPTSLVGADSICYSGGVGEDASFDLELIRRFGCRVFAFDPTPRAVEFGGRVSALEPRFTFLPVGLWERDGVEVFYAPRDPRHVSYSIPNLQGTAKSIAAPVRTVASLMAELGHDHIDVLKLDIEGAEFAVLHSMLDDGIRPVVLCMEIDQPAPMHQVTALLARLTAEGYSPVGVDRWDCTFVLDGGG